MSLKYGISDGSYKRSRWLAGKDLGLLEMLLIFRRDVYFGMMLCKLGPGGCLILVFVINQLMYFCAMLIFRLG